MARARDETIWSYAGERGFAIVSKDEDFRQLVSLRGAPPKVVWLRVGNSTTDQIETVLKENADSILAFDRDTEGTFLVIDA